MKFWPRIFLLSICSFATINLNSQSFVSESKEVKLMGCRFVINVVAENQHQAWDAINVGIEEITRIEKLISSWDPLSQTSNINKAAGIKPVIVDQELFELIARANKVSELTNGAFDISFGSMERIYEFDKKEKKFPPKPKIDKARATINWRNIILDRKMRTVFLKEKGMKIGFGGIGKGYAANRAKNIMESMPGVQGGIVNASGDLIIWNKPGSSETGRNIKISDPNNINNILADFNVNNNAVVTSGDYEKYFTSDGKRYAHIIDPKSGYPTTGIKSVTIICPDAEIADALATSVFVLGKEEGLYLINKLANIEAIIIDDNNKLYHTDNLKLNYY